MDNQRQRPQNRAQDRAANVIDIICGFVYQYPMPRFPMPQGALAMLALRVLQSGSLHGYAIAQRIRSLSDSVLEAEEGSLYPTLQRMLMEGWVSAEWGVSDTGRRVRFYTLTKAGKQQLKREIAEYEQVSAAIQAILKTA
jgi:PadR family transcriptional regulator, regulatory protein PadR